MGLISKTVKVKWNGKTRKYYEEKGYIFTNFKDEFDVKVEDLTQCSSVKVDVKCDGEDCENPYLKPVIWGNYIRYVHEDGKYYCSNCSNKIFGVKKRVEKSLKNSKSFEQWCTENNRQDVLDRWDYDLNKCKPSEVSYCSTGFNKKGYWFKCPKGLHESELKRITNLINGHLETMDCNKCNSFAQWGIDNLGEDFLDKYWDYYKNTVNPWEISWGNHKKVWIKCQEKDYHGSYDIGCKEFSGKCQRCPYCAGNQFRLHPLDSLGKYLEDNNLLHLWSDKNKKSPYKYSLSSHSGVYWKCPDGKHDDFYRSIKESNCYDFRCPSCQSKLGEIKIENYLIKNNIDYKSQKKFDGLYGLGNRRLSYDFYLPKQNILIEHQGRQHEKPIDFGGYGIEKATENFEKQQEHDKRKQEYAKENNIALLEIWYWDYDNIEEILNKYIRLNEIAV